LDYDKSLDEGDASAANIQLKKKKKVAPKKNAKKKKKKKKVKLIHNCRTSSYLLALFTINLSEFLKKNGDGY
jgi:hypothetical protein